MSHPTDIAFFKNKIARLEAENRALKEKLAVVSAEKVSSLVSTLDQNKILKTEVPKINDQINEELLQSNVYKEAILNNTDQVFMLIGASYQILFANKKTQAAVSVLTNEDYEPGINALKFLPQIHLQTFKERFRRAYQGETIEDVNKFKFVGWQWFKYRYTPAYNSQGKIFAVAFSAIEISDFKQQEEVLMQALQNEQKLIASTQENERFLNSIIDNLPIGFQLYDKKGFSIRMNEKQKETLGIKSVDYAVGEFNILEDPIMKDSGLTSVFTRAYLGETITNFETEVDFGKPENHWETHRYKKYYNITVFPIYDTHQQVCAVACLTQDITERKLVVKELLESKTVLEETQEFGHMGTWRMDLKTKKIIWSKQVFESFGLDPKDKEPSYKAYQALIHPDDWVSLSQKVQDTLEHGTMYEMEIRHRQPDNSYKWMYAKGKPDYNETGQIIGISGINLDIDSRKQAEIKMKESLAKLEELNAELEKTNDDLDRFVYRASHDLRAPIATFLGLIELCKLTTDPLQLEEYLSKQEISIKRLDHFIQDILDYSRNSRMEINKDSIDFRATVENIFAQNDYQDSSRKIRKVIDIDQSSSFYTDQRRLNIILNNLISNAIRYSDQWKPESLIEVKVTATAHEALLLINDNGQGIAKEHINKVFEMFYRGNRSKSGSGLGLYIVQGTVDKLSGTLGLTSKLGKGTTVQLKIPNMGQG